VEPLKHVVFQESLGNLYEKTERVRKLAAGIADSLGVSDAEKGQVDRAAALCKADLVTNMVKEFTELQGVMGKEYAERSGEPAPVATAIFEHYLPRFAGDVVPSTTPGAILAVADKIDTIAGYFGIGMEPTGSQDPFGLRRQALGAVNILLSTGWHLLLGAVVDEAIAAFARQGALKADAAAVKASVMDFFKQRVENVFTDRGLRYDEIDAALAIGFDDLPETLARAEALAGFRATAGYETLAAGYTRANNLAKKNEGDTLRPEILTEPQETALYEAYTTTREAVEKHLGTRDYRAALDAMTTLKTPVDEFFDGLMVMVEDDAVRKNRLALLLAVANLMNSVGDLSRLQ
jgi:glycyl-tRNA synthetase beta chain